MDPIEGQLVKTEEAGPMNMLSLGNATENFKRLQQFISGQMKEGVDYGVIPGTKKKSLYKPGAEKMLNLHGLGARNINVPEQTTLDFARGKDKGEAFFHFTYRTEVYNPRGGAILATCDGSCNSLESKYAHEKNPANLVNTIQKIAQKRAMIGAVLIACRASDIFMVPIDDDDERAGAAAASSSGAAPQGQVSSAPAGGGSVRIISEKQVKLVFGRLSGSQKSKDELVAWLKSAHHIDSIDKIPAEALDDVLSWIGS